MFELVFAAVLLVIGYFVGSQREAEHFKSLEVREKRFVGIPTRSCKKISETVSDSKMVMSSVVIANDYFKTFVVGLISIFGGQMRGQESLMDRARREATLRLLAKAHAWGAQEVVGLRMETSKVDTVGVEVFVYGTAIKTRTLS